MTGFLKNLGVVFDDIPVGVCVRHQWTVIDDDYDDECLQQMSPYII